MREEVSCVIIKIDKNKVCKKRYVCVCFKIFGIESCLCLNVFCLNKNIYV